MTDQASSAAGEAHAGRTYDLVFVPGDGIGPEVIAAGRRVLEAAGRLHGFGFEWHEILIGGVALEAYGVPLRDDDLAACASADAVYFGAIGDPRYDGRSRRCWRFARAWVSTPTFARFQFSRCFGRARRYERRSSKASTC